MNNQSFIVPSNIDVITQNVINISTDGIYITQDKLENILHKHMSRVAISKSWQTPAGVLLSLVLTLITSTFKTYGLSADGWQAVFIVLTILSTCWLIKSLFAIWTCKGEFTVEHLISKVKSTTPNITINNIVATP